MSPWPAYINHLGKKGHFPAASAEGWGVETSPEPGVRSVGTQGLPHPTDVSIEAMGPG